MTRTERSILKMLNRAKIWVIKYKWPHATVHMLHHAKVADNLLVTSIKPDRTQWKNSRHFLRKSCRCHFNFLSFNNCVDCEHRDTVLNEADIFSFDQNRLFVCGCSNGPCPKIGPTSSHQFIPVLKSPQPPPTSLSSHNYQHP